MLVFENVTKHYHYEQYPTVENFSLQLTDRLNTVLVDAQSGKTTLAKLVLGLEKATSGRVTWNNKDCFTIDGKDMDATYLCSNLLLFGGKTALYNVAYPLILRGQSKQQAHQVAQQLLQQCGIDPSTKVKKLSPAQQVDVVLARLFARNSALVVVDDFLPLLNEKQTQRLMQFFDQSNCFVVHFTSELEQAFGSVYLWHDGKVVTDNIKQYLDEAIWLGRY